MSRTLPRAAGVMPAKFVSRMTRMAAPEGKATSPDEMKSETILAQQNAKSMALACGKHRKRKVQVKFWKLRRIATIKSSVRLSTSATEIGYNDTRLRAARRGPCKGSNVVPVWPGCPQNKRGERKLSSSDKIKLFLCRGSCCGALFLLRHFVAFPADTNQLRYAGLLHGDTVEHAAGFHGLAVMGDDDELCLAAHFADQ